LIYTVETIIQIEQQKHLTKWIRRINGKVTSNPLLSIFPEPFNRFIQTLGNNLGIGFIRHKTMFQPGNEPLLMRDCRRAVYEQFSGCTNVGKIPAQW
jgi:hypothetical protein